MRTPDRAQIGSAVRDLSPGNAGQFALRVREFRLAPDRSPGGFPQDGGDCIDFGIAKKCASPGQALVENCSYAEDVAAMVYGLTSQLLGRHLGDCANDCAALGYGGEVFPRIEGIRREQIAA